jgi:hypothetical protein
MSEPPIKKNTSTWMTALKEFNADKQWSVPKKGTPEYDAVKAIADRIRAEKLQTQVVVEPPISTEVVPKRPRKRRAKSIDSVVVDVVG